jgi:hypothetical protein
VAYFLNSFSKRNALITDRDDIFTILRISSNDGLRHSILNLSTPAHMARCAPRGRHCVNSVRLQTAISRAELDLSNYDALVMGTQGSELLILPGL